MLFDVVFLAEVRPGYDVARVSFVVLPLGNSSVSCWSCRGWHSKSGDTHINFLNPRYLHETLEPDKIIIIYFLWQDLAPCDN